MQDLTTIAKKLSGLLTGQAFTLISSKVTGGSSTYLGFESLDDRIVPATFYVDNNADAGAGSLRQAILDANGAMGTDDIQFRGFTQGTISLTSGELAITAGGDLTINGPGANLVTIQQDIPNSRVMSITAGGTDNIDIIGLRFTGGEINDSGAGIDINSAALVTLNSVLVDNNVITDGSAGAGVSSYANLAIENSTIAGNQTQGGGGGGLLLSGSSGATFIIRNSTISGNSAAGGGGGIWMYASATLDLQNSTVSGNVSDSDNMGGGPGGGIYLNAFDSNVLNLSSSIVANNLIALVTPNDITGTNILGTNTLNYDDSLIETAPNVTTTNDNGGNIVGQDPMLDPAGLANNGGPTPTIALLPGSPAENTGNNNNAFLTDQRGVPFAREVNGLTDMGAFEIQLPPVPPDPPGPPGDLTDDETFVRNLYSVVLLRTPDAEGYQGWLDFLANGGSRADVVGGFWESAEHRAIEVVGFYNRFLGRTPNQEELAGWVQFMLDGGSEEDVIRSFLDSAEYQAIHPTTESFLVSLYANILFRAPDEVGYAGWIEAINNGTSRQDVIGGFVTSPESTAVLIDFFYGAELFRDPDQAGFDGWFALLRGGSIDLEVLAESLLASDEFYNFGLLPIQMPPI